jgi:capsular polysaccharide biosynthesis protein
MGPSRIALPPLPTGGAFFDLWPVREFPEQGMWEATHYDSFAPPLFVLHDVTVHSSAGILAVGDVVIEESLANTAPHAHSYRALAKGIAIRPTEIRRLSGIHISLLAGGELDYRHALLDGLARLTAVPDNYLTASAGVLVPATGIAKSELFGLLDLLPSLAVHEIGRDETVQVETLVLPLSVCGESAYHPCVAEFFARLSGNVAPSYRRLPRRFYIDGRGTRTGSLRNEGELIAALIPLGFEPVRLDDYSVADLVRLFRQAEAIVAPNGSALANIGFCRPGCLVIELLMDAFVDWSWRNLAGLMHLRYDCVLGRAQKPWPDLSAGTRHASWQISVQHVVAAIAHSSAVAPAARAA